MAGSLNGFDESGGHWSEDFAQQKQSQGVGSMASKLFDLEGRTVIITGGVAGLVRFMPNRAWTLV